MGTEGAPRTARWSGLRLILTFAVLAGIVAPAMHPQPAAAFGIPELLKDIAAGPAINSSSPTGLTVMGGNVYFQAYDPNNGGELWKSDGTAAGTVLVKD